MIRFPVSSILVSLCHTCFDLSASFLKCEGPVVGPIFCRCQPSAVVVCVLELMFSGSNSHSTTGQLCVNVKKYQPLWALHFKSSPYFFILPIRKPERFSCASLKLSIEYAQQCFCVPINNGNEVNWPVVTLRESHWSTRNTTIFYKSPKPSCLQICIIRHTNL